MVVGALKYPLRKLHFGLRIQAIGKISYIVISDLELL